MNETTLQQNDTVTYFNKEYTVVKNEIAKGKEKKKVLISINLISILLMIFTFIIYFTSLNLLGVEKQESIIKFPQLLVYIVGFIACYIAFVVLHEYVHYLTYRIFGNVKKENLKFGLVIKSGMAYCISLEPNTVWASRLSLIMPVYILVVPMIVLSIVFQSGFAAFMCALFAGGSAGDLWYIWKMRKYPKDKYIIEAMPADYGYELGYVVLDKKE